MTIRKLHSNNVTNNRADIATQYEELFFDDATNSILLPDPTGLLETKIGATGSAGIKGFASAYVNAGTFVTLDNIKVSVTTAGNRGLSLATTSGSIQAHISATFGYVNGVGGAATTQLYTYNTTPSGSLFGWSFPNQGDGSTYIINDTTNWRVYRVTLMIGPSYNNNFICIERLI